MRVTLFSIAPYTTLMVLFFSSCQKETTFSALDQQNQAVYSERAQATEAKPLVINSIVHVPFFIEDASGNQPASPNTLLYENRLHNPIIAPDGHQITLAEFNALSGNVTLKCTEKGTLVNLHLSGLIPKGVYTIWTLTFKAPGFEPTFSNLTGVGSLGTIDGSENTFKASASGEGEIVARIPAGPLSIFGSIASCINSEFEVHFVGVYHLDGSSYGATPGPKGTYVEQFAFIWKN